MPACGMSTQCTKYRTIPYGVIITYKNFVQFSGGTTAEPPPPTPLSVVLPTVRVHFYKIKK